MVRDGRKAAVANSGGGRQLRRHGVAANFFMRGVQNEQSFRMHVDTFRDVPSSGAERRCWTVPWLNKHDDIPSAAATMSRGRFAHADHKFETRPRFTLAEPMAPRLEDKRFPTIVRCGRRPLALLAGDVRLPALVNALSEARLAYIHHRRSGFQRAELQIRQYGRFSAVNLENHGVDQCSCERRTS